MWRSPRCRTARCTFRDFEVLLPKNPRWDVHDDILQFLGHDPCAPLVEVVAVALEKDIVWLRIVDSYPEHLRGVYKGHPWPVHRAQPLPDLGDHSSRQFLDGSCSLPIPDVVGSHGQNQQGGVLEGRQMGLESIAGVVLESVCAVLVQRTEKLVMVRTLSDHVAVEALEVTMRFDMTVTREQVVDPHLQQGERFCKPLFGLVLTVLLTFSSHRFFTLGCGSRWKMKTPSDK